MKDSLEYRVATGISKVFEPMAVLAVVTCIAGIRAGLTGWALFLYFAVVIGVMVAPTFVIRTVWLRKKVISDWDIKKREERLKPLVFLIVMLCVDMVIILLFRNTFLTSLFIGYFVYLLGFAAITTVYKISGHQGVLTLSVLLLTVWYGIAVWPFWIVLPLVAWARVVRKNHSIGQVVLGFFYSLLLVLLLRHVFGFFK